MKIVMKKIIVLGLMFLAFFGIFEANKINVVFADEEYKYKIAETTSSDVKVYYGKYTSNAGNLIGRIKNKGEKIKISLLTSSSDGTIEVGLTEPGGATTISTFCYILTESIQTDGGVAPEGSVVPASVLKIIGDTDEPDKNISGGSGTTDKKPETIEDVLNENWYDIPLNVYGIGGVSNIDDMNKLYDKLMVVDYNSLSNAQKEYYRKCVEAFNGAMGNMAMPDSDEKAKNLLKKFNNLYNNPLFNITVGNAETVTPDDIIEDGENFINTGKNSNVATINQENADKVLNNIYNILLAIGITVTVLWGLIIAIKLMLSSVEEKAEYKKLLWPYLIGCIAIFGSFAIWKIVILIMKNVL